MAKIHDFYLNPNLYYVRIYLLARLVPGTYSCALTLYLTKKGMEYDFT